MTEELSVWTLNIFVLYSVEIEKDLQIFFFFYVLNVFHKSEQNTRAQTSSKAQQSPLNKESQKTFLDPSLYQDLQQDLIGSILGWGPSSSHVFWKSFR